MASKNHAHISPLVRPHLIPFRKWNPSLFPKLKLRNKIHLCSEMKMEIILCNFEQAVWTIQEFAVSMCQLMDETIEGNSLRTSAIQTVVKWKNCCTEFEKNYGNGIASNIFSRNIFDISQICVLRIDRVNISHLIIFIFIQEKKATSERWSFYTSVIVESLSSIHRLAF